MKFYMTASQNPEWKDRYSVIENDCFQSRGNAVLYDDSDWFYKKKVVFLMGRSIHLPWNLLQESIILTVNGSRIGRAWARWRHKGNG